MSKAKLRTKNQVHYTNYILALTKFELLVWRAPNSKCCWLPITLSWAASMLDIATGGITCAGTWGNGKAVEGNCGGAESVPLQKSTTSPNVKILQ